MYNYCTHNTRLYYSRSQTFRVEKLGTRKAIQHFDDVSIAGKTLVHANIKNTLSLAASSTGLDYKLTFPCSEPESENVGIPQVAG